MHSIAVARGNNLTQTPTVAQDEKTTVVDPNVVVVSACLHDGNITIRGWERDMVMARDRDRRITKFRRMETNPNLPRELALTMGETKTQCIPFGDIELDVPRRARVNLQTANAGVKVFAVAKLRITTQSGSVEVSQVTQTVDVNTISGSISIRDSTGSFKLHSVGSPIEVHNVRPNEPGESCEATSANGDITLNQIRHSLVKASSLKGKLAFTGSLVWAGRYNFQTVLGDMTFSLPPDASFRLSGTLSRASQLQSDFSLQFSSTPMSSTNILNKSADKLVHIDAAHGTADIMLTIASLNGSIYLQKK